MLDTIFSLVIIFLIAAVVIRFLQQYGGVIVKIITHLITGWIFLFIINLLPGIHVPVNIITMAISGFGGVLGVVLLVLISLIL